jgi:hypothetical protein
MFRPMSDAQAFFTLATHFLRLAESAAELLVRQGNALTVVTERPIAQLQYSRRTRWSDHAVGVAILFNFYHGIELVLKGCLSLDGSAPPNHHKLTTLLAQLEASAPNAPLTATLARQIGNANPASPLGQFLTANQISIDAWYQALKYPKGTTGQAYSHVRLKYGGGGTVAFWKGIKVGAASIRKQAVQHLLNSNAWP